MVKKYFTKGRLTSRKRLSTIKDVAAMAGVSMATVSRVINGGRVRPEAEEKVRSAIRALDYVPNHVARSLKTNRTSTVGFLVSSFSPFFITVIEAVESVLNREGYGLLVCHSSENPEREIERVRMLIEKQVDGILAVPSGKNAPHLAEAQEQGIPVILVDRTVPDVRADCVLVDNVEGAYRAVEHLVTMGHRRIGLINGRQEVTTGRERFRGFLRVFEDYNLAVPENLIRFGDFFRRSGYQLTKELLSLTEPPSAIFVANEDMTMGALKAVQEMEVKVPEDLALVGFDNTDATLLTTPPTTAVVQPMSEIGEQAAQLMVKRMVGDKSGYPEIYRLKPKLEVRGSTIARQKLDDPGGLV